MVLPRLNLAPNTIMATLTHKLDLHEKSENKIPIQASQKRSMFTLLEQNTKT